MKLSSDKYTSKYILLVSLAIVFAITIVTISSAEQLQGKHFISGTPIINAKFNTSSIISSGYGIASLNMALKSPEKPPENLQLYIIKNMNGNTDDSNTYRLVNTTRKGESTNSYIYVEDSEWSTEVTQAEVNSYAAEFENIFSIETNKFGQPPDAPKNSDKIIIVLTDLPQSIAGYFFKKDLTTAPFSNQYEIIYVDSRMNIDDIKSTIAHELNHMIHAKVDIDEDLWISEGIAQYSEFLIYGQTRSEGAKDWKVSYFENIPDTKLNWLNYDTNYDSMIAQYGAAYLFIYYLHEKFGENTVLAIFKDSDSGTKGVEDNLPSGTNFENVFKNWVIANYVDNNAQNSLYWYENIEIQASTTNRIYPDTINKLNPVTGTLNEWAADYIEVGISPNIKSGDAKVTFQGEELIDLIIGSIHSNYVVKLILFNSTNPNGLVLDFVDDHKKNVTIPNIKDYNKVVAVIGDKNNIPLIGDGDYTLIFESPLYLDNVLDIDRSGSMGFEAGKMDGAKIAAKTFVDNLERPSCFLIWCTDKDKVGLVSFESSATLDRHLSSNFNDIKTVIDGYSAYGSTNMGDALSKSINEINTNGREGTIHSILYLTDGQTNTGLTKDQIINTLVPKAVDSGIIIYTLGYGSDVDPAFLSNVARAGSGKYYFAPDSAILKQIYVELSHTTKGWQPAATFSGQISQGLTQTAGIFTVQPGTKLFKALLSWPGSDLDLSLIDPSGNKVMPGSGVIYSGNTLPEYFEVYNPASGEWKIEVYGKDVPGTKENYDVMIFKPGALMQVKPTKWDINYPQNRTMIFNISEIAGTINLENVTFTASEFKSVSVSSTFKSFMNSQAEAEKNGEYVKSIANKDFAQGLNIIPANYFSFTPNDFSVSAGKSVNVKAILTLTSSANIPIGTYSGTINVTSKGGNSTIFVTIVINNSENLIKNPGFENGKTNWTFFTSGIGNFTIISPGFEGNNAANLTLTSNGTNIQLYQKNVTLEPKGIYRLSFAAYSTTGHDVKTRLFLHSSPFTDYGLDQTFDLGTSWQTFTTEFTAENLTTTVNDGRLMFNLAPFVEAGDLYYIDDVRLEKIGIDNTPPTVIGNTPTGNNILADTPITVTFSEKMNQNATQLAFSTSPASNGSFYWKGTNMTYIPDPNLAYNTLYTVKIGTGAKDSAGNNLSSTYSWQFRTILPKSIVNCITISSPGVYALNVDIMNHPGTCINITSSNVIFDGTGHTIDGIDAAGAYGVNVHNTTAIITNITITNLAVTDWDNGINFRNAMGGNISKIIENSNSIGVFLNNSNSNNVTGNNISTSSIAGIKVYSSRSNTIYNNYFNNTRNFVIDGVVYQNTWNTTKRSGKNIIGGSSLGGNFWANSSGSDFSQTCTDSNNDGLCDLGYTLNSNNIDFLPLTSKPAEKWISVVFPNGGENWTRGTTRTINWTSKINTGPYVKIELLKAGVLNRVIIASTPNDGAHPWLMPATQAPGNDYKVRITSTSNASYTDISDNNFTVPVPTINITSPKDGDIWRRGTTQTVRWISTGNPGAYVKIELLKAGVLNKVLIASTPNDGSHPWLILPTMAPGIYVIKITSTANPAWNDTAYFIVPAPSFTVVSPNGGENWTRGTTRTISWNSTESPGTYVKIELLKAGVLNRVIISSTLNDGSHPWLIPAAQTPGNDYKVKITSTINASVNDTSDNPFTIPVPSFTVVSPNGGENWTRGTTQTIKWNSTENPKSYVKIELIKPGVANKVIIASTLNDGSQPWLIPATQLPGDDYKVKITSTINASVNDTSDNNFSIVPPKIIVTSPNGGQTWIRGTNHLITWNYTGNPGTYVKIELLKNGIVNRIIFPSTLNDKSQGWTIPSTQIPGSDYKIRITSTTNLAYNDTSDSNFTIAVPII